MYSKFAAGIAALILTIQIGYTQPLPDSITTKIDNLFQQWDTAGSPGCVVGIVRNDSLVYARGYGLANVEDNIPNTPQTEFYVCSLAKQFTGYAIVLLARQGRLKLDEDIHRYLPWLADFGHKITILNLLNHTSGIRDEADMARIAGLPLEGRLSQQMAIGIIKRQRSLNFTPGEKYAYSNSNYVLLAEIVKVASGKEFPTYVADNIFSPLGMTHSAFMDDSRKIIKRRAVGYNFSGGSYTNAYQYANVLGAGSLFTTVDDMARWAINFYLPRAGDTKDIRQLTEKGRTNNGRENNYALGISVDSSRGWIMYSHNGSLAGYVAHIRIYPDLRTGIILFSNTGDYRVFNIAGALARLLIPDHSGKPATPPVDSSTALLKNPARFKPLEGDYLAANGYQRNFTIRDGQLWMNGGSLMVPTPGDTIRELGYPDWKYLFHSNGPDTTVDFYAPGLREPQPLRFVKLKKGLQLSDKELQAYTGTYYSPELICSYRIILKDHQLFYSSGVNPDAKITLMGKDDLLSDYNFFSHVKILRSIHRRIVGFEVNNEDTRGLKFDKVE